ncbi:hypothetical protein JTE90_005211 [Oedothorax gibbosus]|uniref:Uncharacterized protein n=1 Tax=Oedothorax gibbosus TaxID=931172 RepID=A0AAV6UJN1_9ARAC|nr:hypothetical protein JTE90_005211 [Oedothorax gibbosus]
MAAIAWNKLRRQHGVAPGEPSSLLRSAPPPLCSRAQPRAYFSLSIRMTWLSLMTKRLHAFDRVARLPRTVTVSGATATPLQYTPPTVAVW